MQKYQDTVLNGPTGRPVAGATVTVTTLAGAPATIYSDNGVTPISTLTTRTDGSFAFYAADGRYTIAISGAGLTTKTITDILLEDPADLTTPARLPHPRRAGQRFGFCSATATSCQT
jgi:hypothetical protein